MCLIVFAYKSHNKYKFILASNRDEAYKRPTMDAHKWEQKPFIIAGKDMEQGGTWLGINEKGLFAAVTNYRQPALNTENKLSRGVMLTDFLSGSLDSADYLEKLAGKAELYNGFNLLIGDPENLYYFSNIEQIIKKIEPGLYGISNALFDTPWPKVEFAKKKLAEAISSDDVSEAEIFTMLANEAVFPDDLLPDTGLGLEIERKLSPLFIKSGFYGTRSSNIVTIDYDNNVNFIERVYEQSSEKWHENRFNFKISPFV
jgi:uncharacterized protein with NRDE domain